MIEIRRAEDRGHSQQRWLNSRHSFSFADYVDPDRMGFSVLRVINDDEVAPGTGFPTHGHRDMEIISYVLQGSIEHRDSMGHVSRLDAGQAQRMSAGSGVRHSEYNPSPSEVLRFLQIWIEPEQRGVPPSYEQRSITTSSGPQALSLLVSPDGRDDSMRIHQDALLYYGRLLANAAVSYAPAATRKVYLHVVSGSLAVNGLSLSAGDAVAVKDEAALTLQNASSVVVGEAELSEEVIGEAEASEFLLFDLP